MAEVKKRAAECPAPEEPDTKRQRLNSDDDDLVIIEKMTPEKEIANVARNPGTLNVQRVYGRRPWNKDSGKNSVEEELEENGASVWNTRDTRRLLMKGVFNGLSVHYTLRGKQIIDGKIQDGGVLCQCSRCKGANVVNLTTFEQHAGSSAKRPADHIIVENSPFTLTDFTLNIKTTNFSKMRSYIDELLNMPEAEASNLRKISLAMAPTRKSFVLPKKKEESDNADEEKSLRNLKELKKGGRLGKTSRKSKTRLSSYEEKDSEDDEGMLIDGLKTPINGMKNRGMENSVSFRRSSRLTNSNRSYKDLVGPDTSDSSSDEDEEEDGDVGVGLRELSVKQGKRAVEDSKDHKEEPEKSHRMKFNAVICEEHDTVMKEDEVVDDDFADFLNPFRYMEDYWLDPVINDTANNKRLTIGTPHAKKFEEAVDLRENVANMQEDAGNATIVKKNKVGRPRGRPRKVSVEAVSNGEKVLVSNGIVKKSKLSVNNSKSNNSKGGKRRKVRDDEDEMSSDDDYEMSSDDEDFNMICAMSNQDSVKKSTVKRSNRRGRPPKVRDEEDGTPLNDSKFNMVDNGKSSKYGSTVTRKRGRPQKVRYDEERMPKLVDANSKHKTPKRCANVKKKAKKGRGGRRRKMQNESPELYIDDCCVICRVTYFDTESFTDKTIIICDQCDRQFHVGCLRKNGMCDLKETPVENWFCKIDCKNTYDKLREYVALGPQPIGEDLYKLIADKYNSFEPTKEFSKPQELPQMSDIKWQVLYGKEEIFKTREIIEDCKVILNNRFEPMEIPDTQRNLIEAMLKCNNSDELQDYHGTYYNYAAMYSAALFVGNKVVSTAVFRVFGSQLAEMPLAATCQEFSCQGYFQALFKCLEGLLEEMNVERLVLPASSGAEEMWKSKFNFHAMSSTDFKEYVKDYPIQTFNHATILEKNYQREGPKQD